MHFAELPASAGLLFVAIHAVGLGLDGLAVWDFRLACFDLDLVASFEPFADDLQMQLAHAGDDHLFGLRIQFPVESGVFLADFLQRAGQFPFVAAAFWADGQSDHRRRERDWRQAKFAQRGAGVQLLDFGDRHNVARPRFVDRFGFGRLHLQQCADLNRLSRPHDRDRGVFFQRAGKDADEI